VKGIRRKKINADGEKAPQLPLSNLSTPSGRNAPHDRGEGFSLKWQTPQKKGEVQKGKRRPVNRLQSLYIYRIHWRKEKKGKNEVGTQCASLPEAFFEKALSSGKAIHSEGNK